MFQTNMSRPRKRIFFKSSILDALDSWAISPEWCQMDDHEFKLWAIKLNAIKPNMDIAEIENIVKSMRKRVSNKKQRVKNAEKNRSKNISIPNRAIPLFANQPTSSTQQLQTAVMAHPQQPVTMLVDYNFVC